MNERVKYIRLCTDILDSVKKKLDGIEGVASVSSDNIDLVGLPENYTWKKLSQRDKIAVFLSGYEVDAHVYPMVEDVDASIYFLRDKEDVCALRLYGIKSLGYKYVQYIRGLGLQLVLMNDTCILINKNNILRPISPSREQYGLEVTVSDFSNDSWWYMDDGRKVDSYWGFVGSPLSLFNLDYKGCEFEIIFWYIDNWSKSRVDLLLDFVKVMGLYSKILYSAPKGKTDAVIVIAKSEAIFLLYFRV